MREIEILAPAKVNLFLEAKFKRDDGYWEVETILQTVDLCDRIILKKAPHFQFECNRKELETEDNLVVQAFKIMQEKFKIKDEIKIILEKKIPVGAGLGGGSSDAAATIKGITLLYSMEAERKLLEEIASSLGSDVYFFLYAGTCLGKGRGERITPLSSLPAWEIFLLFFPFPVYTRQIYSKLKVPSVLHSSQSLIKAIEEKDREGVKKNLFNRLTGIVENIYPDIRRIRRNLEQREIKSIVSGSGPTLYGILNHPDEKEVLLHLMKKERCQVIFSRFLSFSDKGGADGSN